MIGKRDGEKMVLEIEVECDECVNTLESGCKIYCDGCYSLLEDKINEKEQMIADRDVEIEELEERIIEFEERIKQLEGE